MKKYKIKVTFDNTEEGVIFEAEADTKIKAYSKVINKYKLREILQIRLL